jgi:hypothetical protein
LGGRLYASGARVELPFSSPCLLLASANVEGAGLLARTHALAAAAAAAAMPGGVHASCQVSLVQRARPQSSAKASVNGLLLPVLQRQSLLWVEDGGQ